MPTLYVENVPADLYDALRLRAKSEGRSISAEVLKLLEEYVPGPAQLAQRRRAFEIAKKIRTNQAASASPRRSTEKALRADRSR